jgi:hypothetical protein
MSFRSANLSSDHYAYQWEIAGGDNLNEVKVVNQLAIEYASTPDGPEKEAKCLEIVRCFHGYLMKYLNMIVRGHLPSLKTPAGKDASKMLSTLVGKGEKATRENLSKACRTMHLAFKQQSSDDIYDTLVMCLMRAIRKYDPHYTSKVKVLCEAVDAGYPRKKRAQEPVFSEPEITLAVGFDSLSYLRMLVRRGHLVSVAGPKKKVVGYKRTKEWPPEPKFFESGPVGFVYFLPMYFRYYLHEHISGVMGSLESKEHVLQLDHRTGAGGPDEDAKDLGIPHAEGALVDYDGNTWAADLTLVNLSMDISVMDLDWVKETNDKLFRKLTRDERYILYLHFVKEYKWVEVAAAMDCDTQTVKKKFDEVMAYLKARANVKVRS